MTLSPAWMSVIIAIIGLIITLCTTLVIVGFKLGEIKSDIASSKEVLAHKADVADINAMKETLAEIKGMFQLKLREL